MTEPSGISRQGCSMFSEKWSKSRRYRFAFIATSGRRFAFERTTPRKQQGPAVAGPWLADARANQAACAAGAGLAGTIVRWMTARRIGRRMNQPISAAAIFMTAAITKTACQLPVAAVSTDDNGTSSDAVPLAV